MNGTEPMMAVTGPSNIHQLLTRIANWNSTFSSTPPVMMSGTPHYLNPIRSNIGQHQTILTQIHKEIYSYVMTQLYKFFPLKRQMKFFKLNSIKNINQKKLVLRNSIDRCSNDFLKQRLELILAVIEEGSKYNPSSEIRFGISSRGMDLFWEEMLLQTIGVENLLTPIRDSIPPLEIILTSGVAEEKSKQKPDGVLYLDPNVQNSELILYDAKHYSDWRTIGTGDITKQYAYERAITTTSAIPYIVRKNCFIFPMMEVENSQRDIISNNGIYHLPYLGITGIPNLQIIELNPYLVLESYTREINHNLANEIREILD